MRLMYPCIYILFLLHSKTNVLIKSNIGSPTKLVGLFEIFLRPRSQLFQSLLKIGLCEIFLRPRSQLFQPLLKIGLCEIFLRPPFFIVICWLNTQRFETLALRWAVWVQPLSTINDLAPGTLTECFGVMETKKKTFHTIPNEIGVTF